MPNPKVLVARDAQRVSRDYNRKAARLSSAAAWAAAQCKVVTSSNVGFVARRRTMVVNPRHH